MWKSRWQAWAPVPNKPTVSVDVKQHFNKMNRTLAKTERSDLDRSSVVRNVYFIRLVVFACVRACVHACLVFRQDDKKSLHRVLFDYSKVCQSSLTRGIGHAMYPRSEVFSRSFPLQRGPAGAGRSKTSISVNYTDLRQI